MHSGCSHCLLLLLCLVECVNKEDLELRWVGVPLLRILRRRGPVDSGVEVGWRASAKDLKAACAGEF